jgi:hypothetical protein
MQVRLPGPLPRSFRLMAGRHLYTIGTEVRFLQRVPTVLQSSGPGGEPQPPRQRFDSARNLHAFNVQRSTCKEDGKAPLNYFDCGSFAAEIWSSGPGGEPQPPRQRFDSARNLHAFNVQGSTFNEDGKAQLNISIADRLRRRCARWSSTCFGGRTNEVQFLDLRPRHHRSTARIQPCQG